MKFIQFTTDNCIYKITETIGSIKMNLYFGIFVDDILCLAIITWFRDQLSQHFTLTFNININSFLGMHIQHNKINKIITLLQPGYRSLTYKI